MKHTYYKYILAALFAIAMMSCIQQEPIEFASDCDEIAIDAVGGTRKIHIASNDAWIASTDNPWLTVSPANGLGCADCQIIIDSTLYAESRYGEVLIQNLSTLEERTISVTQEGFPFSIEIENPEVKISNYKTLNERKFTVAITTNVDFDVEIPSNARWLDSKSYKVELDRGVRPRRVNVEFEWDINTQPNERIVEVKFVPKKGEIMERQDVLKVIQQSSELIEKNTRKGDSVALVSIQRNIETLAQWDVSVPMERWTGVTLWQEHHKGYTPDKEGRVRSAEFYIYDTSEELPFEVKYLTAAEELYFFGNTNTFLKSLHIGSSISELTQLKRLTIAAHGLIDVDESLTNLKNLEYLDLGSNNFMKVPEVITKENFPNLRTLILNANQRSAVYDLSNISKTDIGGFIEEQEFPVHLLKWELDTLNLSVNYLQGKLPTFEDDDTIPVYTEEDWAASNDSLPRMLVEKGVKKVMPKTTFFSINFNRLTGDLPDWLLYHPMLDWWLPYSLIFNQEGKDMNGESAGFDNEPVNLDYYYKLYHKKDKPSDEIDGQ